MGGNTFGNTASHRILMFPAVGCVGLSFCGASKATTLFIAPEAVTAND